jgi:MFS family permease
MTWYNADHSQMLAQMSGINVITFYSNTILQQDLGYSPILSRVISSCLQTWQFFAATSAIFLIDRIGRRRLLIGGAALMAIANAGLAGLQSHKDNATAAGCSLIFYFLALAAFPIGLFLIPFMYSAEIAPLRVRSQITAMSGGFNWLFNFLVAEVTPVAFDSIGWKYYLVSCSYQRYDVFLASHNALQPPRVAKNMPIGVAEAVNISEKGAVEADQIEEKAA